MKLPTETGLYLGIKWEDYERIPRMNLSTLKHMKKSPFHLREAQKTPREDSDPLRIGRATHVMVLEPESFLSRFAIWDGGSRRGKEWEKFLAKVEGLDVLTEDQYHQVKAISAAVLAHEHAAGYLRGGSAEATLLWTDPDTGVECKGRLDLAQEGRALVDLKTTRDASPEAFQKQSWNLGHHEQAAFYRKGWQAAKGALIPYFIVAVESTAPHAVAVYEVPKRILAMGEESNRDLLERLVVCRNENRWPGYADGVMELDVPRWLQKDTDVSGLGLEFPEEQHA